VTPDSYIGVAQPRELRNAANPASDAFGAPKRRGAGRGRRRFAQELRRGRLDRRPLEPELPVHGVHPHPVPRSELTLEQPSASLSTSGIWITHLSGRAPWVGS